MAKFHWDTEKIERAAAKAHKQQSDEAIEKPGERGEADFQRVNVCKWFLQNNCLEMEVECKSDICSKNNLDNLYSHYIIVLSKKKSKNKKLNAFPVSSELWVYTQRICLYPGLRLASYVTLGWSLTLLWWRYTHMLLPQLGWFWSWIKWRRCECFLDPRLGYANYGFILQDKNRQNEGSG